MSLMRTKSICSLRSRFPIRRSRRRRFRRPEIIGLQIGGSGSSVERQGDLTVRKYSYELVPGRSGSITIPAFQVEFQNGAVVDTLTSESITVEVAQPKPVESRGQFVS